MNAATLKKKKSVSKGKIKKTIKNVVCRPDPVNWPLLTDEEALQLKSLLEVYRVTLPEFKKLPWKELKLIPKNERPKPPSIPKVKGLIFGLSECKETIKANTCSAIIIEATVNPKTIVQPFIENCVTNNIPVVCLHNLKPVCLSFFGIPTLCLGIKKDNLSEISDKISELSRCKGNVNVQIADKPQLDSKENIVKEIQKNEPMQVDINLPCPYLYRKSKQHRVFTPNNILSTGDQKQFLGQNFINLTDKNVESETKGNAYMKMVLKKIANNPNRITGKRK